VASFRRRRVVSRCGFSTTLRRRVARAYSAEPCRGNGAKAKSKHAP
jgi:hypothetical protein